VNTYRAAMGRPDLVNVNPRQISEWVQDNQHAIEASLTEFEQLDSILDRVAYIRQQRQEYFEQMVTSFLRVHKNSQKEMQGYINLLHATHSMSVDPQASRKLFWKQTKIASEAKNDVEGQPEFFVEALRDFALRDDFMTHVYVRTAQREKMAENVAKILEEQLKKVALESDRKTDELRQASLTALEAINQEMLLKEDEQNVLLVEKDKLEQERKLMQNTVSRIEEQLGPLQTKYNVEQGRRMQLEENLAQMKQRYEELEMDLAAKKMTLRSDAEEYGDKIKELKDRVADLERENKKQEDKLKEYEKDLEDTESELVDENNRAREMQAALSG